MNIFSIGANREIPTGRWLPIIPCKSWYEKLRFRLMALLYKSFCKSNNICYVRVDTGCRDVSEEG